LKKAVQSFRFRLDPKPDPKNPKEEPASLADTPRRLILAALEGNGGQGIGESQAVDLAKRELLKQGLKLEDFRVTVKSSTSGKDWLVFFDPKVQRKPGGGYWVVVNKANGKAVLKVGD
jgi:hypothetical protein